MTKMKPHRDGFEDQEECVGDYNPDKAEERRCHNYRGGCSESDLRVSETSNITGRQCYQAWVESEERERKAKYNALSEEERAVRAQSLIELRKLY